MTGQTFLILSYFEDFRHKVGVILKDDPKILERTYFGEWVNYLILRRTEFGEFRQNSPKLVLAKNKFP